MKSSKRSSQTDGGVWINSDSDEEMMNICFYISDYGYGPTCITDIEDAAEGIILATEKYNKSDPVNLGLPGLKFEKELVELIAEIAGFDGGRRGDTNKPAGQPRRCLDVSRAKEEYGWEAKISIRDGIKQAYEWYASKK